MDIWIRIPVLLIGGTKMATIPLVDEISNEMLPQYYGAIPK